MPPTVELKIGLSPMHLPQTDCVVTQIEPKPHQGSIRGKRNNRRYDGNIKDLKSRFREC